MTIFQRAWGMILIALVTLQGVGTAKVVEFCKWSRSVLSTRQRFLLGNDLAQIN